MVTRFVDQPTGRSLSTSNYCEYRNSAWKLIQKKNFYQITVANTGVNKHEEDQLSCEAVQYKWRLHIHGRG